MFWELVSQVQVLKAGVQTLFSLGRSMDFEFPQGVGCATARGVYGAIVPPTLVASSTGGLASLAGGEGVTETPFLGVVPLPPEVVLYIAADSACLCE